ncbi:dienelactone hydrolase [Mucilaginibacter sp. SG564]|uniref:alpha/beta hydrolase family protein n=1 Tax=Mucilaginibacter sp. SG564 TaxID=2587022 RepID=UPI001555731A|nr:dienelactone hydrolase [Mucilaginibacter sp. SG564]NOW95694.1 putative dienelactone hydrolase [Mucilaginibacter sp. SG564]
MHRSTYITLLIALFNHTICAQTLIGERTVRFKDEKRNRPLVTEIWYPTTDTLKQSDKAFSPFTRAYTVRDGKLPTAKLPLIMISHGTGGSRLSLEWLADALVQKGFIVAAVDHWGNTYDHKIALEFLKPWERPRDISFVIGSLLTQPDIKDMIDPGKIGMAGFSFGGYTAIALAGGKFDFLSLLNYYKTIGRNEINVPEFPGISKYLDDKDLLAVAKNPPPLYDKRIRAFFAISPALGPGFVTDKDITAPVYIVGSQSDSMAPVKTNALRYHQLIKGSLYYINPGKIGHYVMLQEAIDDVKKEAPTYFTDDASVSRHQVHLKMDSLAVGFFVKNLKE